MEPEVLVFMPNGDVTLTLIRNIYEPEEPSSKTLQLPKKPLSAVQQTPIEEDKQLELEDTALEDTLEDESFLFYAPDAPNSENGPFYPPSPRAVRVSDASSRRDRSSSPPASFWASLKRQQAARNEAVIEEEEDKAEEPAVKKERKIISSHEVHCVVSSRHMILASQVFEQLLTGNTTEAKILRTTGRVSVRILADFDTLVILLNIIHGPSRKVPRQVTLEELSNLAVLVSNFGMIETVQFFSDTWIDALQREGLPKSYNEAVLRLLFVFWVFDRPDEFKNMTRLVQQECDENLLEDAKEIPIPHNIIDAIKREREYAIETAITIIHTLISRYLEGQTVCDASLDEDMQYACDAMILGSLMKSSRKIDIWPRPTAPFPGRKYKDLANAIRGIRIVDVCNRSSRRFASLGTSSNGHGLEDEIKASMKDIDAGMSGLELQEYSKKGDDLSPGLEMFVLAPEAIEEVKPSRQENGINDPPLSLVRDIVPQLPKEEVHPSRRDYSASQSRISTPINGRKEDDESIQEGVKLAAHQPFNSPPQDFHHQKQNPDSRVSSRASDYQVHEPQAPQVKEEPKPVISRNSPSQDWMNPGRVLAKPVVEQYSARETEKEAPFQEDATILRERGTNRTVPVKKSVKEDGNVNGQTNGNGVHDRGQSAHSFGNRESPVQTTSEYRKEVPSSYPKSSVIEEVSKEKRPEKTSSNERFPYPSQKPHQEEIHISQPPTRSQQTSYSNTTSSYPGTTIPETRSTSYTDRSQQPDRNSFVVTTSQAVKRTPPPEKPADISKPSQSERTSYPDSITSSYAVKKASPPPEVPTYQPQRASYAVQPVHPDRVTPSPQQTSPVEKPQFSERNSYNGKLSQAESYIQQISTATKAALEKTYSSQPSYINNNDKSSQPDIKQSQAPSQPKMQQQSSQSSISNVNSNVSKLSQFENSPPQQQQQQRQKPQQQFPPSVPQAKSTPPPQSKASPPPAKNESITVSKEISTEKTETPTAELDEAWGQPQKFNMRKSKKKFTTKF